jgi:hypothetical protein
MSDVNSRIQVKSSRSVRFDSFSPDPMLTRFEDRKLDGQSPETSHLFKVCHGRIAAALLVFFIGYFDGKNHFAAIGKGRIR